MTLSEALPIVRAACQQVLELDRLATLAPWKIEETCSVTTQWEDGEQVQVASVSGSRWSNSPKGSRNNSRMRAESIGNADLIVLYRNLSPGMARLLLELIDTIDEQNKHMTWWTKDCSAIITFAESLQSGQSGAVGK